MDQEKITKLLKKKKEIKVQLDSLQEKLNELLKTQSFSSPQIIEIQQEISHLNDKLDKLSTLEKLYNQLLQAQNLLTDPNLASLAQEEIENLRPKIESLLNELTRSEQQIHSFVMEIRAGAGGEEAALFARDLFRMYSLFLQDIGASLEISDVSYSDRGGYKFISAYVRGPNVYYWFQYESGVHRVQRVPITESSGRIHTSTVSVAILPEHKEIKDIQIKPDEIEITPIKASGPGGQHVNKNLTAVRIKHLPTGIIVTSQRYKSQKQNRELALKILKMKLLQQKKAEEEAKIQGLRRQQIGTMDRSEKIRTYNYPQNRMTDHRIKKTWYNLQDIMDGKIKDILEEIINTLSQQEAK